MSNKTASREASAGRVAAPVWGAVAVGAFLAGLGVLVWLTSSDVSADQESRARDAARRRVAAMSQADRDRLVDDYRKFRSLPAEQQEELRQLHRDLEQDARDGGQLVDIMDAYYGWVQTVPEPQRTKLRLETDPARRERMVAGLRTDQKPPPARDDDREPPPEPKPRPEKYENNPQKFRGLSPEDLAAVMDVVGPKLRSVISDERRGELDRLQGLPHTILLMRLALEEDRERPEKIITEETLEQMVGRISNSAHRDALHILPPPDRKRVLVQLMIGGIHAEFDRHKPTAGVLEKFLQSLPETQRKELMRMPLEEKRHRLMGLYMAAHPETFHPQFGEFLRFLERNGGRGRFPGPNRRPDSESDRYPPRGGERFRPRFPPPPHPDERRPGDDRRPDPKDDRGPDDEGRFNEERRREAERREERRPDRGSDRGQERDRSD